MRFSIRNILVFAFALLAILPVTIVGYLSYNNIKDAIDKVSEQFRSEIVSRANERIQLYLRTPQLVNKINYQAYKSKQLQLNDIDENTKKEVGSYFWKQLKTFQSIDLKFSASSQSNMTSVNNTVNSIYFGTCQGDDNLLAESFKSECKFLGAERGDGNNIRLQFLDEQGTELCRYDTNNEGVYTSLQGKNCTPLDVNSRPWYTKAKEKTEPVWTEIYSDGSTREDVITAAYPVFDGENFIGVLASDFLINEINDFLESLRNEIPVESFIIEVSSINQISTNDDSGKSFHPINPIPIAQSSKISKNITNEILKDLENIYSQETIEVIVNKKDFLNLNLFYFGGEKFFVKLSPLQDYYGVNWRIGVALPQSYFSSIANDNTRNIIGLWTIAFLLSIGLAFATTKLIYLPIQTLRKSLQRFVTETENQAGNLSSNLSKIIGDIPDINVKSPIELRNLANAYNRMKLALKISLEETETANKALLRFVPHQFALLLEKDIDKLDLGDGKRKRLTILFSDIRQFTDLSENLGAEDNFLFINGYLSRMEPAITENYGFIDKYIGDAIMALFNRRANDAIKAGLDMQIRLAEYNREREQRGRRLIRIGIGIHTGELFLGTVGGETRMDTTVISRNVNLASRIEGLTKKFEVVLLVSRDTLFFTLTEEERQAYYYRWIAKTIVKGFVTPVDVYEIQGLKDDAEFLENDWIENFNQQFEIALKLYYQPNYDRALQAFRQALEINPSDNVSQYYIQECQEYLHGDRSA